MGTSAILTQGLGVFGSSSLMLTQGLGFGAITVVTGCVVKTDCYQGGSIRYDVFQGGSVSVDCYQGGSVADQAGC